MSQASITGIDHALIGVRDLEAARTTWIRLGFTVTPRGRRYTGIKRLDRQEGFAGLDPADVAEAVARLMSRCG